MEMNLSAGEKSRCEYCGSYVTRDFRRVYGDDNDRAHRCHDCDTLVRLREGSAAGLEVRTPDPQESPGRHGSETAEWCQ